MPDIARGRCDLALARLRDSLERLAHSDPRLAETAVVGGYWTRTASVEVDLVGVDQWPGASRVSAVGLIRWRDRNPFDQRDLADHAAHCADVPGGRDAPLVAVSRAGCTAPDLTPPL
ncbi:MAG: hypothetical protein ACRDSR_11350 [Pseudonocardiaceae bacterium]